MADTGSLAPATNTGTPTTDTSSGGIPATIVTSGLSKSNYNNNVATLNNVNTTLKQTAASNPSVVDFLNLNGMKSDFNSLSSLASQHGIQGYVGSASQNTQLLNSLRGTGTTGADTGNINNKGGATITTGADTTKPLTGTPTPTTTITNNDGSTISTMSDGSSKLTYSDGQSHNIPAGMDTTLFKMSTDNIRQMAQNIDQYKSNVDKATSLVVSDQAGTNPAMLAAAQQIKDQYDVLINQMQAKNNLLLGSYAKTSARTGMLQYANEMDTNFKSMELDRANQRVADLVSKRDAAVLKSNAAFLSGDVKALDEATKELQATQKESNTALMDLQAKINTQIKTNDAEIKQAQANARNATLDSLKVSTAVAREVATQLSGVKDQASRDKIIQDTAATMKITDPMILKSAVEKEQAVIQKEQLGMANTQSIIAKRGSIKGKTASFKTSIEIPQVTTVMEQNKGSDGYVDPNSWVQARTIWMKNGGTQSSFNSNFKSYLNPDSYSVAGLKTSTKKSGSSFK